MSVEAVNVKEKINKLDDYWKVEEHCVYIDLRAMYYNYKCNIYYTAFLS